MKQCRPSRKSKIDPKRCGVIVVDAQKGFTDPEGSFASAYGTDELSGIGLALARLQAFLQVLPDGIPTLFVRSKYQPGQFTLGDRNHPMAHLCVLGVNCDCDWATGIAPRNDSLIVTKHITSATGSGSYRECIQHLIDKGVEHFVFCGFTLTTCVRQTAADTLPWLERSGATTYIALDITGARSSSYQQQGILPSVVEQVKLDLGHRGVKVTNAISEII